MNARIILPALLAALACAGEAPLRLTGDAVAVEAQVVDGALVERYLARRGAEWIEVARNAPGLCAGPVHLVVADRAGGSGAFSPFLTSAHAARGAGHRLSLADGTLTVMSEVEGSRLIRRIALDGAWVKITTRLEPARPLWLRAFADQYLAAAKPDWSYAPSVGGFDPDAKYKSPLILAQSGRSAVGIIPELAALDRAALGLCPHALDLDVPGGPLLTVGFMPARKVRHTVFAADGEQSWEVKAPLENSYLLQLDADAEPGQAFRRAVRLHWSRYGRAEQARAGAQQQGRKHGGFARLDLWDSWRPFVWTAESRAQWLELPLPGGGTGGAVSTQRPHRSLYFSTWFNSLRTAVGMGLYARRSGDAETLRRARQTLDLALALPGRDGAFKCIAVPQPDGTTQHWAGDGKLWSLKTGYLGYDMSWTAYWLLKWRAAGLPGSEAILPRCQALASFLLARQYPDGLIASRFDEDGSADEAMSRQLRAESGPIALFLLELNAQAPDPKLVEAALKALAFLDREVVATRQWYDFETFFSCNARPETFDQRTQQWPVNNLAMSQTVSAYLKAWQATGDRHWLDQGGIVLDYLLLFQQCWTSPSPRMHAMTSPTMLLGGFTTQNADAEWSDARQSQIGNALLDWYRETGTAEYLERGVAALRAQFPVSPDENWAHEGWGGASVVSSFHWGTGSGMAGIELEEDFLRDAIVDLRAGVGVGVNGLDLTGLKVDGTAVSFALASPFAWSRPATVVFRHAEAGQRYAVTVNGAAAGTWSGAELQAGVAIAPAVRLAVPPGIPAGATAGWGTATDRVIADFEGGSWGGWTATGAAFGDAPAAGALPGQTPVDDFMGKGLANSFRGGDSAIGTLTSPAFVIDRGYLNLLVGGGGGAETTVTLVVDGKPMLSARGRNSERLAWTSWNLAAFKGRTARVEIADRATGAWGHILADQIVLSDTALARPAGGP
ncbi:MAG: carbohydrate porin [Planctomycetes bacterium]|nr:carbohydrate porin [Planctomycetota bacterium]